jgi:hypothetical protein
MAYHTFLPYLRPLIASGLVEGTIQLHRLDTKSLTPTREQDGFEKELRAFADHDGKVQTGGRAALFLKGKIKGSYLLTIGYDSDKDHKDHLLRDIQPDIFYPVYGDASISGFDVQSASPLYVRVDKNRSYFLVGDFSTQTPETPNSASADPLHQSAFVETLPSPPKKVLGAYSRTLNGFKEHYDGNRAQINVYGTQDDSNQVVEEIPALGLSGPYFTSRGNLIRNSEKVELITRDRNQPSVIIKAVPQARFSDYAFEPFTGRILFSAPVASLDEKLNPVFIRITFEVAQGGESFWVVGADGQYRLTNRLAIGGSAVRDDNPLDARLRQSLVPPTSRDEW